MEGHQQASESNQVAERRPAGHWSTGLLQAMNDPHLKVSEDDEIVVITDKYPKAKHHYLVMPKKDDIHNLKAVTRKHLPLLEKMHDTGEKMVKRHAGSSFRLGYHAVPSMVPLHLHVISQDFVSPCLKTKKHWNSFTTEYFISSDRVLEDIRRDGAVNMISPHRAKELLNLDLRCHKCGFRPKNMPDLKRHLESSHADS